MNRYPIPTFEYCLTSSMRSLHGCILYSAKNPIAQATNEPCGCIYGKNIPSIHAEMRTLHRARCSLKKINNPVLVVVRYNRQGELVNSYPCNSCVDLIKKSRVVKVLYSDENGNICTCRTKDLKCKHVSAGYRNLNINIVW